MGTFENQGNLFKAARWSKKLTQAELAKKLGIHSQFVSNWERGLCGVPKEQVKKAASILGVEAWQYMTQLQADFEKDAELITKKLFGHTRIRS